MKKKIADKYSLVIPVRQSLISLILILFTIKQVFAGNPDTLTSKTAFNNKYSYTLTASAVGLAGATLLLNEAWYKNYPRSSFHFYNDWNEWLQMDKAGHITASYTLSLAGIHLMKKTGMDDRKSAWIGGLYGPAFLLGIEILDGFSEKWGFSVHDMTANLFGSAVAVSQELIFNRQIARIKYSYHKSGLAVYRPDALGKSFPERMLKDYNGQTYWLSLNLSDITGKNRIVPGWLNISLGYSANGMLGGYSNPLTADGKELPYLKRYRQFYLAPDIDMSKIKSGSKTIDKLFAYMNFLKAPLPAIEYNNQHGFKIHLLFF